MPIKEIYDGLYDGPHATPKPAEEGPVFLGIKNVTDDGSLDLNTIRHIDESEFGRWTKRVEPRAGDIVFTYEATLNRYAIIPERFRGCLGRRMALIRPNPKKIDTRFLHFYFFGKTWRDVISNNTLTGATVDRIPLTTFPDFPITIPPLPTQRKIAGILSAYDDLIENNLRRIRILEEMAQSLYREWFVHFRFPGHEEHAMTDSPLGPIPEGWEILPINELCSLKSGYAFKSKDFDKDGEWPLVTIKNVQDRNFIPDCQNALIEVPAKVPDYCYLEDGDLLLSLTGNIGRVCIVYGGDYLLNQRVAKLVPQTMADVGFIYCFFADEDTRTRLENIASGVAQQNLSPVQTGKTEIVIPPREIRDNFASFANKSLEQVVALRCQNQKLRQTRDLLLPKLLSPKD